MDKKEEQQVSSQRVSENANENPCEQVIDNLDPELISLEEASQERGKGHQIVEEQI